MGTPECMLLCRAMFPIEGVAWFDMVAGEADGFEVCPGRARCGPWAGEWKFCWKALKLCC